MLDGLADIAAAWRTIVHVSEWTGLSIGALAAGAGVIYLRPALLKPVLVAGAAVLLVWIGLVHGDKVGRADVNAQWADARAAAIKADQERDAMMSERLDAKYQPVLADLQKQADERKARSDGYERQILGLLAKNPAAGSCELGAAANRVRRRW